METAPAPAPDGSAPTLNAYRRGRVSVYASKMALTTESSGPPIENDSGITDERVPDAVKDIKRGDDVVVRHGQLVEDLILPDSMEASGNDLVGPGEGGAHLDVLGVSGKFSRRQYRLTVSPWQPASATTGS